MNTRTHKLTYSFFFIYYLKKKMFYHKSHWNVLLKKKIYIFFQFFLFSDHLTVFFSSFQKYAFCFHYIPPKKKTLFVLIGHKLLLLPCSDNLLPSFKVIIKKNAQKEIIHSYHFGFYKLIQSHMCYTGLELEHCKIVFLNPVIFNSWLHERTGNSNDVIRIPPTYCLFFFYPL